MEKIKFGIELSDLEKDIIEYIDRAIKEKNKRNFLKIIWYIKQWKEKKKMRSL